MARIMVVTSGKGGVGKSTFVALLGRHLAHLGQKVLMIDADLGLKNLDVLMGLESRVIYDLEDVLKGRASLSQALVQDKVEEKLYLLPACIRLDVRQVDETFLIKIVNALEPMFDFILIDCPAGIEKGFHNAVQAAHEAIVVVTPDKTSLRDADKVIGLLKTQSMSEITYVLNRATKGPRIPSEELTRLLDVSSLGEIPMDAEIAKGQNYGLLLSSRSLGNRAIENIARKMVGAPIKEEHSLHRFFIKSKIRA